MSNYLDNWCEIKQLLLLINELYLNIMIASFNVYWLSALYVPLTRPGAAFRVYLDTSCGGSAA